MPEPVPVAYLDHTAKLSGGEIALVRLLESLDRDLYRPVVVLAEDGPLVERLRALSVEVHVLPLDESIRNVRKDSLGPATLAKFGKAFGLMTYSGRLARLLKRLGIRLIHTNSLKADLYGAIAGKMIRRPVVWHIRDHIDPSYLPLSVVRVVRFLARRWPDYIVANSQSTLDRLLLGGSKPAAVVPSGISVVHDGLGEGEMVPDENAHVRRAWGSPVKVGIIGRLAEWKGQHIFLEAAARVLPVLPDTEFLIAGSALFGEEAYEQRLKDQVERAQIADKVRFLGFVSDIPKLLSELDILVHASTTPEPFGQVVIEGMAEGLPVIGSDGGGVREIITDGVNGLLTPMGDAEALAEALMLLLKNPRDARKMGRSAWRHVRLHFTAAHTARKVEQVYREILG